MHGPVVVVHPSEQLGGEIARAAELIRVIAARKLPAATAFQGPCQYPRRGAVAHPVSVFALRPLQFPVIGCLAVFVVRYEPDEVKQNGKTVRVWKGLRAKSFVERGFVRSDPKDLE